MTDFVIQEILMSPMSLSNTFQKARSWLHHIDALIIDEKIEDFIIADHEKRTDYNESGDSSGWVLHGPKINWAKRITLRFIQIESGTRIEIIMDPPYEKKKWHDFADRKHIWLKFVGDLAQFLDIKLSIEEMKRYYNKVYFNNMRRDRGYQLLVSFMFIVMSLWGIFTINDRIMNLLPIIFLIYSIYALGVSSVGYYEVYKKYNQLYRNVTS